MEIKPQAMAIPRETDHLEKGKYGPIYPRTPACHGFSILAKIIPGREPVFHEYARKIEASPVWRGHRQLSISPPKLPTPAGGAQTRRTSRISSCSMR